MNLRKMLLFIFIVVFRSYGSEFDKELTMVRMERHLIIAKNGQSLDFPRCDAHAISIDYFQKTGTGEIINKRRFRVCGGICNSFA